MHWILPPIFSRDSKNNFPPRKSAQYDFCQNWKCWDVKGRAKFYEISLNVNLSSISNIYL